MSRVTIVAVLAVLGTTLGACASTNQVLASEVDEVFHTAVPPQTVAACFAHRNHMRVIERPDGARVAIFRNGYGGVTKTFSIYPDGSGTRIESRHNSINPPGGKWKRCVGVEPMRPGDAGEATR